MAASEAAVTAVMETVAAHSRANGVIRGDRVVWKCRACGWDGPEWTEAHQARAAADAAVDADRASIQAETISETAKAWQVNGWADVLLPAPKPPAVPAIAHAQAVTDWLRARADRIENQP